MADDVAADTPIAHSHLRSSHGLFQQKRSRTTADDARDDVRPPLVRHASDRYNVAYFPPQRGRYQERDVATYEDKIGAYNRRMSLEAFKVKPTDVSTCTVLSQYIYVSTFVVM